MKRAIAFILVLAVLLPLGSAFAAEYTLRTSTNMAATGTIGRALQKFVDLVNEKTEGRIEAVCNFGNELGSQSEQVEMAQLGTLEMVVAAPGTGPGVWVPEFLLFEFPYLFTDNAQYRRMLKGMEAEVSKRVQPYGFVAMAGQSMGARHMLTVKPVEKLEDMKNLKMRGPNAIYISMFNHLGAAGTTTDWNEIYTALQNKTVDGMEASPSMIHSMRFEDNAKNMTITNHIIAAVYYFFNEKWYNALPDDLRQIVNQCAEEAVAYQMEIDDLDNKEALDAMIAEGLNVIELKDAEKWAEACAPMQEEYRAKGENWASFLDMMLSIE